MSTYVDKYVKGFFMGKLRFLAALWAAKLSIVALKITRHNGTNFPGPVFRRSTMIIPM